MSFLTGPEAQSSSSLEPQHSCRRFTISEIQIATRNFDESLVIGSGGFGKVYKATIITNGESLSEAAVKRLEATSNQGAVEFLAEIEMLSELRHCHLVSLIGYCNDGKEMILVYQYMPHGTLSHHLHNHGLPLSWVRRLKICIGAAHGLHYLHTGTGIQHGVIHRDVKSSNILLDDYWEAKISDFGLSKIGPTNQPCTSVSTLVKGTFGYLDPDYVYTGRLTRKSDVYAFGVVLFEVLCGKQAVDRSLGEEQWSLARWAQDSIKEGMLKHIVDTNLRGRISTKCLKEFARLADSCLHSHPKQRPTMREVVVGLESVLALQEKSDNMLQPGSMTIFGRKVPKFIFPSNQEHSVKGRSLKSLDIYLYMVGGENRTLRRFGFHTIKVATENFSTLCLRHENGRIFKGRLQNGQDIAILEWFGSFTDYGCHMNEALALVKLEHKNLIGLLGYCIAEVTVYFVYYDFAPHTNLDDLINDYNRAPLNGDEWYKILLGVAQALAYLHKLRIIHSDVNLYNILFDESLVPKLSGFGYSRCFKANEPDYIVVDEIRGTRQFMAPEYLLLGRLSTKADVFSFGVLILRVVFWRRFIHDLVDIRQLEKIAWREEISSKIGVGDSILISRCINIALLCTEEDANDRPSMDEVIGMLLNNSSHSDTLPLPKKPLPLWSGINVICAVLSLPMPPKSFISYAEEMVNNDSILGQENIDTKSLTKLLLVGQDQSGTSTIYKQAKILYNVPFSEDEHQKAKWLIQSNLYLYISILLKGLKQFEEEYSIQIRRKLMDQPGTSAAGGLAENFETNIYSLSAKLRYFSDWLLQIVTSGNLELVFPAATREYSPVVEELWNDKAFQATYARRTELHELPIVANYFLPRAVEISRTTYEPSDADILYADDGILSSIGITSMEFSVPSVLPDIFGDATEQTNLLQRYQLIQVNSSNLGDNCNWLNMFEGINLILYCVDLASYNEFYTDNNLIVKNKMLESKNIFENIITHPRFKDKAFLLILNKFDLLEKKIKTDPLSQCEWFHDFNPFIDTNQAFSNNEMSSVADYGFQYIGTKFKRMFSELNGGKLYVSLVTGLEVDSVDAALRYGQLVLRWPEDLSWAEEVGYSSGGSVYTNYAREEEGYSSGGSVYTNYAREEKGYSSGGSVYTNYAREEKGYSSGGSVYTNYAREEKGYSSGGSVYTNYAREEKGYSSGGSVYTKYASETSETDSI